MKKVFILITAVLIMGSNGVFADVFSNLSDITPVQQEQLTQIHEKYKQENNNLETKIMEYNAKIAKIKMETDKSASEISILTAAYQRNIDSLKAQQERLNNELDMDYKAVLTEEQYKQYELQKDFAQAAFGNFLQK